MRQYYINVPFTPNRKIFTYTGINLKKKWLLQMVEVTLKFNCGTFAFVKFACSRKNSVSSCYQGNNSKLCFTKWRLNVLSALA